jgi:hypothetical protein
MLELPERRSVLAEGGLDVNLGLPAPMDRDVRRAVRKREVGGAVNRAR